MPVSRMGTTRAAPLQLQLEPDHVLAFYLSILEMVILDPGANTLLRINKGGQGRGKTILVAQLGHFDG